MSRLWGYDIAPITHSRGFLTPTSSGAVTPSCVTGRICVFRSQPNIAKLKRKNKSRVCPLPTKRPDYPLCQAEEMLPSEVTPQPPPLITYKRGRPRSIYTALHSRPFCFPGLCFLTKLYVERRLNCGQATEYPVALYRSAAI